MTGGNPYVVVIRKTSFSSKNIAIEDPRRPLLRAMLQTFENDIYILEYTLTTDEDNEVIE